SHRHDPVDPEQRREADRLPKLGVVPGRDRPVWMQRVARGIQRCDPKAVLAYLREPGLPAPRIPEQPLAVAVVGRAIASGNELEVGDLGGRPLEPGQDLVERAPAERLRYHAEPHRCLEAW